MLGVMSGFRGLKGGRGEFVLCEMLLVRMGRFELELNVAVGVGWVAVVLRLVR